MPLTNLRKEIDKIDYKIHDLLNERAQIALQVGKAKVEKDGEKTEFYRPERERNILEAIKKYNKGPLSDQAVSNIFKAILTESVLLQKAHYQRGQDNDYHRHTRR